MSGWCFWRRFAYVFASLCGIVLPKIARTILLLSGALFGRNFWERFVLSFCVKLVFFVVVSPMFLIHYVALLSGNLPEKFSSSQVRFLE